MTANQIAFQQLKETNRHNLVDEAEKNRHNYVTEVETQRHNLGTEQAQLTRALNNPFSLGSYFANWEQNPWEGVKSAAGNLGSSLKNEARNLKNQIKSLFS